MLVQSLQQKGRLHHFFLQCPLEVVAQARNPAAEQYHYEQGTVEQCLWIKACSYRAFQIVNGVLESDGSWLCITFIASGQCVCVCVWGGGGGGGGGEEYK